LAIILAKDSEQVESIIKTPDQIDPVVAGKKVTGTTHYHINSIPI